MVVNMGSLVCKSFTANSQLKGEYPNVDGGLGPLTIKALKNVELERVRCYRVKYYMDLISRKPSLEKFIFGWFKRSLEV